MEKPSEILSSLKKSGQTLSLRAIRNIRRRTTAQMAEATGLSRQTYVAIESGRVRPRHMGRFMKDACVALGVSYPDLAEAMNGNRPTKKGKAEGPSSVFLALRAASGLSLTDCGALHGVRETSVKNWLRADRGVPDGVLRVQRDLVRAQEAMARKHAGAIDENGARIVAPADDVEAQALGLPCVSAWWVMAGRMLALLPDYVADRVRFVYRDEPA